MYECYHCFDQSSRNNHLKIHKGEKDYECSVCLKKFLVKASFLRHLRVHTQEKPFQCPHCKHRFKEQGSLKRHIRYKSEALFVVH
ncbi:UNVERIFIED_CONTAM: hypothetical protein GTU68_031718 [Idotea baltica]|nr:hypothetical protein [Idotea baltica]